MLKPFFGSRSREEIMISGLYYEKFGIYTVKSAYKLLFNRKFEAVTVGQPSSSSDAMWKGVWKLNVPPKVRVFWWRAFHEFLPSRYNLWRRHIEPVAFCEILKRQSGMCCWTILWPKNFGARRGWQRASNCRD
jgi:hypothetical protein